MSMKLSLPDHCASVPVTVVMRVVDDAAVLLDTASGRYFTLDEIGRRAWMVLTEASSLQTAYDTLLREYDVSPAQLQGDLESLIAGLVQAGLLELRPVTA